MIHTDVNKILNLDEEAILSSDMLHKLEKELEKSPWFQAGWMLSAKMKYHQNTNDFDSTLNKTAAYALDRSQLFDIIYTQKLVIDKPASHNEVTPFEEPILIDDLEPPKVPISKSKEELQENIQKRLQQIEKEKEALKEEEKTQVKVEESVGFSKIEAEEANTPEEETQTPEPEKTEPPLETVVQKKELQEKEVVEAVETLQEDTQEEEKVEVSSEIPTEIEPIEEVIIDFAALQKGVASEPESVVEEEKIPVEEETAPSLEQEIKVIDEEEQERLKHQLIDRFIEAQPSVNKPSDADYKESSKIAKESLIDRLDFVSETLAQIYVQQGNPKKAIEIYKQLSLKYPEKKLYFAAQIQKLNK